MIAFIKRMTTSVALCTYNGAMYLEQQLRSIAEQSHLVDEIVICDDKSKDNTCTIIERFAYNYPDITLRLIKNETTIGFLRNFEKALSCCSGDIIFLCDQDDIWMRDKVSIFLDYFDTHEDIAVAFSDARLINSTGTAYYSQTLFDVAGLDKKNKLLFNHGFASDLLSTSGRMAGCTSAIRSSFLPLILPFKELNVRAIHDEIIAVSAASYNKLGLIDKCLVSYRQHERQTIGISLLFKFPPRHQGLAEQLRRWDMEMIDKSNIVGLQRQEFIETRFWALQSHLGWLSFCHFLFAGLYRKYYSHPFEAWKEDISGYFYRRFSHFKSIWRKRLSWTMKYCWNG